MLMLYDIEPYNSQPTILYKCSMCVVYYIIPLQNKKIYLSTEIIFETVPQRVVDTAFRHITNYFKSLGLKFKSNMNVCKTFLCRL